MKKPLSLIAGLLVMWGLAMVAVPEVPHESAQTAAHKTVPD
jgi:hypothetical protein